MRCGARLQFGSEKSFGSMENLFVQYNHIRNFKSFVLLPRLARTKRTNNQSINTNTQSNMHTLGHTHTQNDNATERKINAAATNIAALLASHCAKSVREVFSTLTIAISNA